MNIRLIAAGEEKVCNDFHNNYWGRSRTLDQWRWEFDPILYQSSEIPFAVAEDEGRIVGTQALIPIRMIDEGGVFWTAKSEETLVDSDYRGRQLGVHMYNVVFDWAARHNMPYIWGFTQATRALTRVNFELPATTSQLFLPFSMRSIEVLMGGKTSESKTGLARKIKTSALRAGCSLARLMSASKLSFTSRAARRLAAGDGIAIRTLDAAPEGAGEVCRRFVEQWGGKTIYRDTDYLRWRLFDNPHRKAVFHAAFDGDNLVGWTAVTMNDDSMAHLVDVITAPVSTDRRRAEETARALLVETVRSARNMGALGIRGWHVNDHPFDKLVMRAARKIGFYHIKRGYAMVLYRVPDIAEPRPKDREDDWYVTRIYTDGVFG